MLVKDLIKNRRQAKGLSMAELGRLVGVSRSTVSRWESGDLATMKQTKIKKLADALGLSPIDLLPPFRSEQEPRPAPNLTEREQRLVDCFRLLDARGQALIESVLEAQLAQLEAAYAKKEA